MRALVTGVAGFIGSHIAERLIREGHEVVGIDNLSAGYLHNIPREVAFLHMDVCDIDKQHHVLRDIDVVFHEAASKKNICLTYPHLDMEVNGIGTLKLLQECVRCKVGKFIHASTGSVYGDAGVITEDTPRRPVSFYGVSKTAGESYVQLFSERLNTTILRYFHVWGDRQETDPLRGGVVAIFADKIKKGEDLTVHGDGSQQRVFTSVEDIVNANMSAMLHTKSEGKIYNCASSKRTTVKELAEMLMIKYNRKVNIIYGDTLPGDIYSFHVDASRISEIGVRFRPINELL